MLYSVNCILLETALSTTVALKYSSYCVCLGRLCCNVPQTPNSDLVYSLARQTNNPFGIDQNTGEVVLLNSLDFETTTSYAVSNHLHPVCVCAIMIIYRLAVCLQVRYISLGERSREGVGRDDECYHRCRGRH